MLLKIAEERVPMILTGQVATAESKSLFLHAPHQLFQSSSLGYSISKLWSTR